MLTKWHLCCANNSLWQVWNHIWGPVSTLLSRVGNTEFDHLKTQDRARPQEVEKQKEVLQLKQVSRKKTRDMDLSAPPATRAWEGWKQRFLVQVQTTHTKSNYHPMFAAPPPPVPLVATSNRIFLRSCKEKEREESRKICCLLSKSVAIDNYFFCLSLELPLVPVI